MNDTVLQKSNRLINEKSPYLLQHAHNPVEWYPWGEEAFERARKENKPILLSIGYSTCHWCHVMEKESFSNPEIAAMMNERLISIKIDREERPDIDKVYMTAVTAMTGSGGWPLNVFLTPDLKPFFGGTYFPPGDRWGRSGWTNLVQRISETWANPEGYRKLIESAEGLSQHLQEYLNNSAQGEDLETNLADEAFRSLELVHDPDHGGFGGAPKFPMPVYHNFLQTYYARNKGSSNGKKALQISLLTLRSMAQGGIYDQIGGGFHRYSTDAEWRIPHFEKMLYDNAQLAVNYLNAYAISRDTLFERTARQTLDYLLRDMTHPKGGFYSAEDADSLPPELARKAPDQTYEHKSEGAFYLWGYQEIFDALGKESGEIFSYRYGVGEKGNAKEDPLGEFTNKNIFYVAHSVQEAADKLSKTAAQIESSLDDSRNEIFQLRSLRPRPQLDDKILTSWNGLAISAFAKAYQILADEKYLSAAQSAARFVWAEIYDSANRQLFRRWRDNDRKVKAVSDDYAFMAQGFLDLYEADFNAEWLMSAVQLTEDLNRRFFDAERGGFFMTEAGHDPNLLVRSKEDYDNVEPSASSIACMNLLRLAQMTGREDFSKTAEQTLKYFSRTMKEQPRAMPQMIVALDFWMNKPYQIIILGNKNASDTNALLREIRSRWIPNKILLLIDSQKTQELLSKSFPFLAELKRHQGKATAYICVNQACQLPITDAAGVAGILGNLL